MTCRPMMWIAAAAVVIGAATSSPSLVAADPAVGWTVTVDAPAAGESLASQRVEIRGAAARLIDLVDPPTSVAVTVEPRDLPPTCGPATGRAPVIEGRYIIELDVSCNGPHQIQVVAHTAGGDSSGQPATQEISVAERPVAPGFPELTESSEGGLVVRWQGTSEPDAIGWDVRYDAVEVFVPGGATDGTTLPPASRRSAVSVRAVRWGAGGPRGTTVVSEYSVENILSQDPPTTTPTGPPSTDPPTTDPPTTDPPTTDPPSPNPPAGTGPTSPSGGSTPTRGTGAPSTTLPEGYSPELPFGTPDKSFVPGGEPTRTPSSNAEERAVSSSAPIGGLVRTTEKQSPGLVAPFALGLLMITIAVHIYWYLRRTRPSSGGQVRLP